MGSSLYSSLDSFPFRQSSLSQLVPFCSSNRILRKSLDLDTCWGKYRDSSFVIHMLTSPPPSRDRLDFWRLVEKMWRLSGWEKKDLALKLSATFYRSMSFWEPDRDRGLFMGGSDRKGCGPNLVATWFESWPSHLSLLQHVSTCFNMFHLAIQCLMHLSPFCPPFLLIYDFTLGSEAWTRGSGKGGKKLKSKFCERFSLNFKQSSSMLNLRHDVLHAYFGIHSKKMCVCVWWRMKNLQCCIYSMQEIDQISFCDICHVQDATVLSCFTECNLSIE